MSTDTVLRELGPILAHGEPDDGIGQGESTETAAHTPSEPPAETPAPAAPTANTAAPTNGHSANNTGELVTVDFGGLHPTTPPAA